MVLELKPPEGSVAYDLLRNAFGIGQGAWNSDQWVAFEVDVDIVAKAN